MKGVKYEPTLYKNCCRGGGKGLAFTLAEVLITLGIIGVVAALTLPNLVANYKKQVLVTQLKAEVNIIENSFKKILANEGVDDLNNTPLFNVSGFDKDYYISQTGFSEISNDSEMEFAKEIRKKRRSNPYPIFYLNNGSCFAVMGNRMSKTSPYYPVVYVDVNCDKNPNSLGYDQFAIQLNSFGQLKKTNISITLCNEATRKQSISFVLSEYIGYACFSKVVQDGWKINY